MFKRLVIFGASRGLGRSLALFAPVHIDSLEEIVLVSRKKALLDSLGAEIMAQFKGKISSLSLDLSNSEDQIKACDLIDKGHFDLVLYSAGGGPHGPFEKKDWKDHNWALQLNLISPMGLIHRWLKNESVPAESKFVVVGSRVVENEPDPLASSYAASKMGIYGFINSLQSELEGKLKKVWLYSPGYMDTDLLPMGAKVRHDGSKLMSPDTAAQALLRWVKKDGPWHRVIN